jgi:hypothetical protein
MVNGDLLQSLAKYVLPAEIVEYFDLVEIKKQAR